jgi:hypothetical protein
MEGCELGPPWSGEMMISMEGWVAAKGGRVCLRKAFMPLEEPAQSL